MKCTACSKRMMNAMSREHKRAHGVLHDAHRVCTIPVRLNPILEKTHA